MTGATAGLGRATVMALGRRGANLVLLARNTDAARLVAIEAAQTGAPNIEVIECDLGRMSSVRRAAAELIARVGTIDALVHVAAVVTPTRAVTAEGNEMMLATNYLGPWLLTNLLIGSQLGDSGLRLISVGGPLDAKPDLADLDSEHEFSFMKTFERTKTALNLFTAAAPRHCAADLRAVIYSPGLMKTGLSATVAKAMARPVGTLAGRLLPDPDGSAEGLADLILSTDLKNVAPGTLFDRHGKASPMPLLDDVSLQDALWGLTSQLLATSVLVTCPAPGE